MSLPTRKLPRGTRLYHGTSADEEFVFPDGPAWFSDAETVAEYFQTWRGEHAGARARTLHFWVDKSPKLLLIRSKTDFYAFEDEHEKLPDDPGEMSETVCRNGYDGWIIPNNYPDGADIMLCCPERWLTTTSPRRRKIRGSGRIRT